MGHTEADKALMELNARAQVSSAGQSQRHSCKAQPASRRESSAATPPSPPKGHCWWSTAIPPVARRGKALKCWGAERGAAVLNGSRGRLLVLPVLPQVTTWTPFIKTPTYGGSSWPATSNIDGYSAKQWGGLSRLSHAPRLQMFVDQLAGDLKANRSTTNLTRYIQRFVNAAVIFENQPCVHTCHSVVNTAKRAQEAGPFPVRFQGGRGDDQINAPPPPPPAASSHTAPRMGARARAVRYNATELPAAEVGSTVEIATRLQLKHARARAHTHTRGDAGGDAVLQ